MHPWWLLSSPTQTDSAIPLILGLWELDRVGALWRWENTSKIKPSCAHFYVLYLSLDAPQVSRGLLKPSTHRRLRRVLHHLQRWSSASRQKYHSHATSYPDWRNYWQGNGSPSLGKAPAGRFHDGLAVYRSTLLVTKCIDGDDSRHGVVGDGRVKLLTIMTLFISLVWITS